MPRGGARPNAGRKPGSPNKKTIELQERVAAEGVTPLDYMLSVMRDEKLLPDTRLDAARSAAPYVHARLASIEVDATAEVRHVILPTLPTAEEWEARHDQGDV